MSTLIQYPVLPQQANYCTVADVKNLIGNVAPIANGDIPDSQITTAITNATRDIESRTNRFFSPRRIIKQVDGNGHTRMVLPDSPIININKLSVYFTYPLALSRTANDWDLLIDRASGIISFPSFNASPFYQPFAFTFFKSSRNVTIDAWYGYTRSIFSDTLKSTDNTTYNFSFPTVVKQAQKTTGDSSVPPAFFPIIYKNGVAVANTIYTLVNGNGPTVNNQWQIASDNLVFTLNSTGNGYSSITFNTPNGSTDVITADYAYWLIPEDIAEATAKRAAITLLASFATASFADLQFQGASEIQMDGSRIRYQNGGQFGEAIADWKIDIQTTVSNHKKVVFPVGIGYTDNL